MARLFTVSIYHDSITHWATIVNYPGSPLTFEVSFVKEFGPATLPKIILEKRDGKFVLAKNSPVINEDFIKAVVKAVENLSEEKAIL